MLRLTRALAAETGQKNLCLAGGVALNCVANGKVLRDGKFERIWIQPAAGDAGGALGAALAAYHLCRTGARTPERRRDAHAAAPISGRPSATSEIAAAAAALPARVFDVVPRRRRDRTRPRDALADEQGGRLVPGPHGVRAARARRPLDPRRSRARRRMQKMLNLKVKYREIVPAVRAGGAARGCRRLVRARRRQPVHAAGRRRRARAPPRR